MKPVLVHASCVALGAQGVLLLGASGTGKSELALRLIQDGARLVADDRTVVTLKGKSLHASTPASIAGLLEVRGVGIVQLAARPARLKLAVQLGREGPRLPPPETWQPATNAPCVPLIRLNGRHAGDAAKIALAVRAFAQGLFRDTFHPK